MKEKVVVYIDGFNLYFGLKQKDWKRFYWLNLYLLSHNLLKENQELVSVKYFTSRVAAPPDKVKRQGTFIEALETLDGLEIFYGHYQSNYKKCKNCGYGEYIPNEKRTDVNIAVEMLCDAYQNLFDTAILISADSDLTAPIRKIRQLFSNKKVIIAFPPARYSFALAQIVDGYLNIGRKTLLKSIFPDNVIKKDGFILKRPPEWL
jgi:uncharacterized LabA/DUF88 family protein